MMQLKIRLVLLSTALALFSAPSSHAQATADQEDLQSGIPPTVSLTPMNPVAYSGIYPHTAVSNTHNECAVGGLVVRGDTLYFITYAPHRTTGSTDRLHTVDLSSLARPMDSGHAWEARPEAGSGPRQAVLATTPFTKALAHTTYLHYPGNTDANRYRDTHLGIDVLGAATIDRHEIIRFLPVTQVEAGDLVGRITGTAAHLYDPDKLYYMTMEEGLYEVDFSDLDQPRIAVLRTDGNHGGSGNLPGAHGKGFYTAQGHLFYTNNAARAGARGCLVMWDGTGDPEQLSSWTVVDTAAQYTEVTSRRGPADMDPASSDPVWATGWDAKSLFIHTRDANTGHWTRFRLPISSYTHGHPNGWYTEWPRIRSVGLEGGHLMSHHGMLFLVPESFSATNRSGITPLTTHHKMIVDYAAYKDQIIIAANDASIFNNRLLPRANSNIQFVDKSELANYGGKPSGFGGFWIDENIPAATNSDPFLIHGFQQRILHFEHENPGAVEFVIEVDCRGDGRWSQHTILSIDGTRGRGRGYGYYILPEHLDAPWIRIRPTADVRSVSAYFHLSNGGTPTHTEFLASLADPAKPRARSQGLLRSRGNADFKLEFAADRLDAHGNITGSQYYLGQLNPATHRLELIAVDDSQAEAELRTVAATSQDFTVDAASVIMVDGGTVYRLPKSNAAFSSATASGWRRGVREVVTERALMNIHGTVYELPRDFDGGGFARIRPITTHRRDIFDFMSWRGMLVLSGNHLDAIEDGHYVASDDGRAGLWFGNVDDLWSFGPPEGMGGPWKETPVTAHVASDPYLMAGYDHKQLELAHTSATAIQVTMEVDFLGTNQWQPYGTFHVPPGKTLRHTFERGYAAHWVRLISDTNTTMTAWFTYRALDDEPSQGP